MHLRTKTKCAKHSKRKGQAQAGGAGGGDHEGAGGGSLWEYEESKLTGNKEHSRRQKEVPVRQFVKGKRRAGGQDKAASRRS